MDDKKVKMDELMERSQKKALIHAMVEFVSVADKCFFAKKNESNDS